MVRRPLLYTLLLALLTLAPSAAFADRPRHHDRHDKHERHDRHDRHDRHVHRWDPHDRESHRHHAGCRHARPPAAPRGAHGWWELRTTSRWVPAHFEQRWVPEECERRGRHGQRVVCREGYYAKVWVEGYHEPVEEWVWVASARPRPRGGWGWEIRIGG